MVTRIDRGRRTPVSLETIGIAQAADGTAFVYGEHMAMPSTAGRAFDAAPTGGFSYGSPTWVIPAGAIRDEDGNTYIIGYMTTPRWTRRGTPLDIKLPRTRVAERDRLWLYDYESDLWDPWVVGGGGGGGYASATATATGNAVATATAGYPGGVVTATDGGGHRHDARPKGHVDISDPGSTGRIYQWPIIDAATGEVTTYSTTKPTWGRVPEQGTASDERAVDVRADAGTRAAPPPVIKPVPEISIRPLPPRFGAGAGELSLQRTDLAIADARIAYLDDIAWYADECDSRIEAAAFLTDAGLMSSEMTGALRVFRLSALDRHAQYDGDVHRAIRGARLAGAR